MSHRPDVWTAANDGSGSNLDADKLDNLSSADFALVAHVHASIDDITDVSLSAPGSNEFLFYNGSAWVNRTHTEANVGTLNGANDWSGLQTMEAHLDVEGDADNAHLQVLAYGTSKSAKLRLVRAKGTVASPTAVLVGETLGDLQFGGYGSAFDYDGGLLRGIAAETWTGSAHGTDLQFFTTPVTTVSLALAMTIEDSGDITFGPTLASDLQFSDIGTNDWEIRAQNGSLTIQTLGSTTATGDGAYIDDGGTNNAKIAGIKNITATGTAPTGDYPYGTLHLIY